MRVIQAQECHNVGPDLFSKEQEHKKKSKKNNPQAAGPDGAYVWRARRASVGTQGSSPSLLEGLEGIMGAEVEGRGLELPRLLGDPRLCSATPDPY